MRPMRTRVRAGESFRFPLLSDSDKTLAIAVGATDSPSQWMAQRVSSGRARRRYLGRHDTVDPRGHAAQVLDVRARGSARSGAGWAEQELIDRR
jgi:peroxiredoxin